MRKERGKERKGTKKKTRGKETVELFVFEETTRLQPRLKNNTWNRRSKEQGASNAIANLVNVQELASHSAHCAVSVQLQLFQEGTCFASQGYCIRRVSLCMKGLGLV